MSKWSKEGRQVGGEYSGLAKRPLASWVRAIVLAGVAGPAMSGAVLAQDIAEEEVVVTGTRQIIQDQIAIKRDNIGVVDGLSASDIGDLPALSIGEALESITGAASHRENGGATEISIRGLGPFLSATNFNGREATNGSGDRSVNFSQFPSELMSKLAIHKTQDASMIEGGVAGVISLETLKPLDYGKRRFQIDGKLNINPDELNVDNRFQDDIGTRITTSYVDQVEFNDMALGWSLGYQNSAMSQPEAEARSSSPSATSLYACLNEPSVNYEGMFSSVSDNCEDQVSNGPWDLDGDGDFQEDDQGYITTINPDTGEAYSEGQDFVWTGSSRGFRQNETSDNREAFFAAVQFQPSEQWDINLDVEMSERVQAEERHDIYFDQKWVEAGVTGLYVNDALRDADGNVIYDTDGNFTAGPNAPKNHVIQQWAGDPFVNVGGENYSRTEVYHGGGLAVTFTPTDALTLDLDIAHSRTTREELQLTAYMRSTERVNTTWERDNEIPVFTVTDFDVTDPYAYLNDSSSAARVRADRENTRENVIDSIRFDAEYALDMPLLTAVKGGFRASKLTYKQFAGVSDGNAGGSNGYRTQITSTQTEEARDLFVDECAIVFPESDFFSRLTDGPLFTEVDSDGNVVNTTNSFAAFDNKCLSKAIFEAAGEDFQFGQLTLEAAGAIDVTEETNAAYVMADYELDSGLRGNVGVRVVQTDITSVGYRSTYSVIHNDDGTVSLSEDTSNLERVVGGGNYTEVLPSAMFVYDLNDDMILRGGLFRGLSRVDPKDMSYSRSFSTSTDTTDSGDAPTTVDELLTGATGTGNPNAKPYASWNTDISWEWYPNDDAILAIGLYHKLFTGGTENNTVNESFTIDGDTYVLPITNTVTTDKESTLYGIEITGSYRWDSGVGVKFSYNHANSDFEMEDSLYGDVYTDGVLQKVGIIPPASIAGFSEDTFSGQLYYQIGEFDVAAIYKYRSEYFQPYTSDASRLRYVDSVGVWEARASYKLTDNIKVKVEAINLFSEPKSQYYFQDDNPGEFNDYGPRLFLGVSAKF